MAIMHGWWGTLAERSRDPESVTLGDVLTVVDLLGRTPDAVDATAEAMFEAIDEDGDDRISLSRVPTHDRGVERQPHRHHRRVRPTRRRW
ncbi:hypothetical protein ACFSTC_00825 [Nonomuraea ferruginea]